MHVLQVVASAQLKQLVMLQLIGRQESKASDNW
jgi:hypothetical protein